MSAVDSLLKRIDSEFDAAKQKVEKFQQEELAEYHQRQERVAKFGQICEQLQSVWKPRLDALAQRFGEKVSVSPHVAPNIREAVFHFKSQLARVELTFAAMTDPEVRKLVLHYDLEILPILMQFKNTDRLEVPLEKVDPVAIGQWIDDRIVDFVKTWLAMHSHQQYLTYLKHYMVEDPIAGVRFPKYAAGAKCEYNGQTQYFLGEDTCQEFCKKNGISR